MSELPSSVYIHDAGAHSVSLWAAGLCLLQLRTGCSTTYWELADPPAASTLSFGTVGVIAVLGAGGPFGPLTQDTVFGHDTGLEGYWCSLLRAHAGHMRRQHAESLLGMGFINLSRRILTSVNVIINVINLFPNATHKLRNISMLVT